LVCAIWIGTFTTEGGVDAAWFDALAAVALSIVAVIDATTASETTQWRRP
jgi:hypothetical protein